MHCANMRSALALVLLSAGGFQSGVAIAQDDAVVVTATRFPERALEAPIGMTVIGAARIASSTASTLPELLSQEAGIVARDNTGSPDWQVDLRGFGMTGDQNTLVLLNGQRLNEIELTTIRWSSIPLDSIERIEILRGSGAVQYGGGASGGTINIITKAPLPDSRGASIGAISGSRGLREMHGGVSLANDRLGFSLRFSDSGADNYRQNNRVEQQNVEGELRYFADKGHASFRFGLDNQSLRLPGERTTAQLATDPSGTGRPGDYSTRDGAHASLGGSLELGRGELAVELGYRQSGRASLLRDYAFGIFNTYTDTRVHVWSLTPRFKLPFRAAGLDHSLVIGVDTDDWDYVSNRSTSLETLGNPAARVIATQQNQALYAQNHTALGERTKLTLGMRQHRVTTTATDRLNPAAYATGAKTSSPRAWEIGLRHNLSPATAVYGRMGESFRTATVDESYAQFGGPVFDAIVTLLEPQTSHDQELGMEFRREGLRARASAYEMRLNNEIHFFAPTFSNINLPPTTRKGMEFELSFEATQSLSLFGNLSLTEAKFRNGRIGAVDVSGKYIPLVPRETANAGFAWRFTGQTQLRGVARYVGKQFYDNDQTNTFPSRMPAYGLLDLKLTHDRRDWAVSLAVNNVLDKQHYSHAIRNGAGTSFNAYPQGGRTLQGTLELRFR
jgi:iron complex outermembrane receptor protein